MYEMGKPSMGPKLSEVFPFEVWAFKSPMAVSLLGRREEAWYTKCASSVEAEILTPPAALTSAPSTGCSLLLSRG